MIFIIIFTSYSCIKVLRLTHLLFLLVCSQLISFFSKFLSVNVWHKLARSLTANMAQFLRLSQIFLHCWKTFFPFIVLFQAGFLPIRTFGCPFSPFVYVHSDKILIWFKISRSEFNAQLESQSLPAHHEWSETKKLSFLKSSSDTFSHLRVNHLLKSFISIWIAVVWRLITTKIIVFFSRPFQIKYAILRNGQKCTRSFQHQVVQTRTVQFNINLSSPSQGISVTTYVGDFNVDDNNDVSPQILMFDISYILSMLVPVSNVKRG